MVSLLVRPKKVGGYPGPYKIRIGEIDIGFTCQI